MFILERINIPHLLQTIQPPPPLHRQKLNIPFQLLWVKQLTDYNFNVIVQQSNLKKASQQSFPS